jgi:hypothetical protein
VRTIHVEIVRSDVQHNFTESTLKATGVYGGMGGSQIEKCYHSPFLGSNKLFIQTPINYIESLYSIIICGKNLIHA